MLIAKREELSSVVAFDVIVIDADEKFEVDDFTQSGSEQVAYDEVYLSSDGHSVESDWKLKNPAEFRVYFFLHDVDNQKPLISSYGELKIPDLKPLPNYLEKIHPFSLVD